MKAVSFFDYVVAIGVCIAFPVMIPVAVGVVVYMAFAAGTGGKDEHK